MSSGPTWQHPPTYDAPDSTLDGASVTSYYVGPRHVWVPLSQPWPEFG